MINVLLVEDDKDLNHLLKQYLELNDFKVDSTHDGIEALELLKNNTFNIVLLDVMMPQMDGFELAKKLKLQYPKLPFLFLTARNLKEDIIQGLKIGADDYITKPFDVDELILRIQNILKRNQKEFPQIEVHTLGSYKFDVNNLTLSCNDYSKTLTEKEAQILNHFSQNKNQIVKRDKLLKEFWNEVDFFTGRSLDVFISKLRKYLSKDKNINIESIRGVGFKFICP